MMSSDRTTSASSDTEHSSRVMESLRVARMPIVSHTLSMRRPVASRGTRSTIAADGDVDHRGEGLAPRDAIAAVDPPRARERDGGPDQAGRRRLREISADELLLVHHHLG